MVWTRGPTLRGHKRIASRQRTINVGPSPANGPPMFTAEQIQQLADWIDAGCPQSPEVRGPSGLIAEPPSGAQGMPPFVQMVRCVVPRGNRAWSNKTASAHTKKTEPKVAKCFIPIYPNKLPTVPKPPRARRAVSLVVNHLPASQSAITRFLARP